METTRQTILSILRRRRRATVDELTKELGLAPATVRRHLDILARDSHVEVAQVRRKTGRPHYVFSLSEAGEDLFPKHYVRITNRMIEEIVALEPEETAERSGPELANLVFEKMARRLAQRIAPHVHGATLPERVHATMAALSEEGIAFDVEERDGEYLLLGRGCPCPRVADKHRQVCAHDQQLLSTLLAADVTSVEPATIGEDGHCAYRVRERTASDTGAEPSERDLPSQQPMVY
ncbi:MAG: ArsR family transcriptional regulator [Chloroflexi bacterium]|nr:ArsR family transcriptional regulator [Chloroflexota bacterium]